jgi:hypothetical protein
VLQLLDVRQGEARFGPAQLAGGLRQEVLGQQRDVFHALAQRRQFDGEDAEPIVQVLAEAAGIGDAAIAEVVAHVALDLFTNYFNNVAQTDVDFPKAPELTPEPAGV